MKSSSEFPKPIRDTPELREAFLAVLEMLFAEYPPMDFHGSNGSIMMGEVAREGALRRLRHGYNVQVVAHWASDCGVPNDLIHAQYVLLFT